jgi:anti-repressor protein
LATLYQKNENDGILPSKGGDMNQLQRVFDYGGRQVRTVLVDGEPWFVAKDVCDILEIENPRDAMARLEPDERGVVLTDTLGGPQSMNAVPESGLYSLILGSRKPEARQFKRWVTHEVLPTIRKTGAYLPDFSNPAIAARAWADEYEGKLLAQAKVKELEPKAAFFDAVADSKTAIAMGDVAKVLAVPGIGRNKLFEILRDKRILQRDNVPYQEYVDRGYFRVIEQKYQVDGEPRISIRTLVYQKGLDYIRKLVAG